MTPELLSGAAAILLSLAFSYIPGLQKWYAKQDSVYKSLTMLAALALVSAGAYGISCYNVLNVSVPCTQVGAVGLAKVFVTALVANQSTYLVSPQKAKPAPASG